MKQKAHKIGYNTTGCETWPEAHTARGLPPFLTRWILTLRLKCIYSRSIYKYRDSRSEQYFDKQKRNKTKTKQHASQGDDARTVEAAPGSVGRGEQGEAKRAKKHTEWWTSSRASSFTAQKNCARTDFSIAQTTGQHNRTCA